MDRVIQIQVVVEPQNDLSELRDGPVVDIFALTDDGRLLIRPVLMKDYETGEWKELTFPPKKVPTQVVK